VIVGITLTAGDIAERVGGKLVGDSAALISGVAKIEEAGSGDLTFVANPRYARYLAQTKAGAILVKPGHGGEHGTLIEVADPYAQFLRMLEVFHPRDVWIEAGVHPTAVIHPTASVAENVTVGAFGYVGARSRIGAGSVLYPHVTIAADVVVGEQCEVHSFVSIRERVKVGNRVIVQDGAIIGTDGFGFVPDAGAYRKIPHMGTVTIGDDVEIGANTTIDRATLGETVIGAGTKLDNLIQIAHNVAVGKHTVIAAQTGVSGSSRIGDHCQIGGQVGIIGHLRLGDRVQIGAQSGVAGDVADGDIVSGSPARPHSLWKRIEVLVTRLPELVRRIRVLEAEVLGKKTNEKDAN
jgi:UDP-3-O-[3-hydroxymyristoyl] glucosamine N-acyltransferase